MDITLKPGTQPYAAKPYRVSMDDLITNWIEVYTVMTEEEYVKGIQYSDPELRAIIESLKQPDAGKALTDNYSLSRERTKSCLFCAYLICDTY